MIPERLFFAWVDYAVTRLFRLQAELEELRARVGEHEARITALEERVATLEDVGDKGDAGEPLFTYKATYKSEDWF